MKRNRPTSDLSGFDDIAGYLSLNNDVFMFYNTCFTADTGMTPASVADRSWLDIVHREDLPRVYRAGMDALHNRKPYVVDSRWLRRNELIHHWRRWYVRPIFDPLDQRYILHAAIGVEIATSDVQLSSGDDSAFNALHAKQPDLNLVESLIHARARDTSMASIFEGNPVAFIPRHERVKDFGYRVAFAHPGREGYRLMGYWPFLPTANFVAPWFRGQNYGAAQASCGVYNQSHGYSTEAALNILHAAKCLSYVD